MEAKFKELKARLLEVDNLQHAAWLLGWDQKTYMPSGGAPARARQMATLERLKHEKLTDPAVGRLLDELQVWAESLPYDSDEAALVRVARREYERFAKVPASYVARLAEHSSKSFAAWQQARPRNDFAAVQPVLEKALDLSREYAGYFPGYEHSADPLIDFYDCGMKVSLLRDLFSRLREQLVPLVEGITAQAPADDSCLRQSFPQEQQRQFFTEVLTAFGLDWQRGRQDVSAHPFTTRFSISDVRITVRYVENMLSEALFSALHEAGHAMYEQGSDPALEGTLLAGGNSSGVHESQSRLWENIVGRSRGFWSHYYPRLKELFPDALAGVPLDSFYRAVNKVERSLIRTEADEVTYNLHIMVRFRLELDLLEGKLAVRDLPDAWRGAYRADLGILPPDDRDGVMQDVHWYDGWIGGVFQGYTLGNILGAQFYEAALKAHPEIPGEIEHGKFDTLHRWLKDQIYWHGSKFTPPELVERVTGGPMQIAPYINYVRAKYGELYRL